MYDVGIYEWRFAVMKHISEGTSEMDVERYTRQMLLPEVGEAGQKN